MGIFALIIGCIFGYLISEKVVAKNTLAKIGWAIGIPVALLFLVVLVVGLITGSGYIAGAYSVNVISAALPYAIIVLIRMKTANK